MIPKIIHQTHSSGLLSDEVQQNMRALMDANPEWEHRFYDEQDRFNFIRTHYDLRVLRAYNRINPMYAAARADFFRYLLMYRVGGVYLDLKSGASKPLSEITGSDDYLLSHWDNDPDGDTPGWGLFEHGPPFGEFQQWHIACRAEHPFLEQVIHAVLYKIESYDMQSGATGIVGVTSTTGPVIYTLAIMGIRASLPHRWARSHRDLGFVYNTLSSNHRQSLYSDKKPHYSTLKDPVIL